MRVYGSIFFLDKKNALCPLKAFLNIEFVSN